ncbi:pneumococcal serine-rich repeat protein [Sabethes cyaneus]|uniref:pneumococcal serine-rich repeat protein n=1 Tax=Sabethes cyaneus TaxID=53552 RepID=UPI00237E125D|nr:pneumococcal serine-rich repeat protein [Sabethes cyaneus]
MRPGPGLVVMALAFISGARRGTSQQSSASQGSKLGKFEEDNTEALSRINPWLSACDLAQPNSAPDLQGQCSAGTLPVAWIDEGPGPPRCPPPCKAKSNNKNSNYKPNNIDNTKYNMENRLHDKQQCLDYLGDNEELSPAQICKKSSQSIETKLKTLRLRHCCERTVGSALHNAAYAGVLRGGSECVRMLSDLLETDALAARITCEFTEVLVRYDCGQPFSIIHHCEDCKEAYRRWGCSMLLPFFTTREEVASVDAMIGSVDGSSNSGGSSSGSATSSGSGSESGHTSVNNKTGINGNRTSRGKSNSNYRGAVPNKQTEPNLNDANKQQLVENISITVKSSRRKTQRVRIRPCLDVCQTVEQKCPYMLPGDRAPAYPTQYAGEPTFLCRDLNIEETGEQRQKSNSGPIDCCYDYCGLSPRSGVCTQCDPWLYEEEDDDDDGGNHTKSENAVVRDENALGKMSKANKENSLDSSSSSSFSSSSSDTSRRSNLLAELRFHSELPPRLATCPSITSATIPSTQSEHCKSAQQLLLQQQLQQQQQASNAVSTPTSSTISKGAAAAAALSMASPATPAAITSPSTNPLTPASSSASSTASSSSFLRLTSIKSVYGVFFNNSWTMRLRCLDEFVAWTKILLQLAGL